MELRKNSLSLKGFQNIVTDKLRNRARDLVERHDENQPRQRRESRAQLKVMSKDTPFER